jgi:hypothetical protein
LFGSSASTSSTPTSGVTTFGLEVIKSGYLLFKMSVALELFFNETQFGNFATPAGNKPLDHH